VGDADQSIYYWRGAAPDNLARLKEDFPGLAVYPLGVTYRCPPAVANLANQLISRNAEAFHGARARLGCPPGQWAGKGAPGVTVKHCPDKEAAAGWVVGSIAELLAGGEEPGSVAVLYRSRRSKGSLPEQLRHAGLPFVVAGEKSLSCRATTRELFAFADACLDPVKNDGALLEVAEDLTGPLKLGLGPRRRQDAIDEAVAKGLALAEVLLGNGARTEGVPGGTRLMDLVAEGHDRIADGPHKFFAWARLALLVDERLEKADKAPNDVNELLAAAEKATFDGLSVVEFMERLALDDEVGNNPGGAATLSTVHAAKGLEWPHVFVVGLDKNVWPDRRSPQGEELAEERRLLHVAITRTQWHLYVAGTTDWTASPWLFEVAREARSWDGREG
jgi:ATP-dependent DNA helicase Rep